MHVETALELKERHPSLERLLIYFQLSGNSFSMG